MGRDFSVLQEFKQTGKPPLLGPQTSALPFNQSAFYFYLLFPMFVVSGESLLSSHYTLLLFYTAIYLFGAFQLRHQFKLRKILLLTAVMLTIMPQLMAQNRFVWNPSFLPPLIVATTLTLIWLIHAYSVKKIIFLTSCLSLALALSYSVAPFFIAVCLVSILFFKRRALAIFMGLGVSTLAFQLPTGVFELRHNFLLTKALLAGNFLAQERTGLTEKLHDFSFYFLTDMPILTGYLIIVSVAVLAIVWWWKISVPTHKNQFLLLLWLGGLTLLFSLVFKTSFQAHYIFPLAISILMIIASMPDKLYFLYLLFLSTYWLAPAVVSSYWAPARHNVRELTDCASNFCQQSAQPIFVAVQAGYHPYHNGPEFRYLFKRHGCQVKSIETEPQSARQMALVIDDSSYEHGKTQFNELTLLGPSQVMNTFTCSEKLQIIILQRE